MMSLVNENGIKCETEDCDFFLILLLLANDNLTNCK